MKHNILLAFQFAKRDFKERYVGMGFGQFWFIINPIIMITIYTIIFSEIMKLKLNLVEHSYAYSVYIVSGIIAWTTFTAIINRTREVFYSKANLIKKVNVPAYSYMLSILITESTVFIISMILGVLFLVLVDYSVSLEFLWIIPVLILQVIFSFSLGVIIALFTPFIKDLKAVVPILLQLWFWLTPIIYMKELTASKYPWLLEYNPFYQYLYLYQDIFVYSKSPSVESLLLISFISCGTLLLSGYLYKNMIAVIKDII